MLVGGTHIAGPCQCLYEQAASSVGVQIGYVQHRADHIGVCLDTCHLAVSFADPAAAVARIADAGVRVVKVQASAALHVERADDPDARRAVEAYAEDRYLHQVREDAAGGVIRVDDLPEALDALPATAPWRVHFHVPLHLEPEAPLSSTTVWWI